MRLLYVCSDFGISPRGTKGASVHLCAITRALAGLGHEVLLLSPHEGPGQGHPAHTVLTQGQPLGKETSRRLKRWFQEHGLEDGVAKELRALAYNTWVSGSALEALADDPPHAILERLSLFGHAGLDLATALNVPLIVEVNAPLTEEARRFRSLELSELADDIQRRVLSGADAVVAVSGPLSDHLAATGVASDKLWVVPNGVSDAMFGDAPSRAACRAKLGLNDEFVIGFAGSLKDWHGVDVLVDAFGRLAQEDASVRLLIVGQGPAERRLRTQVTELDLQRSVVFRGAVPHEEMPALLRTMDVAVAPFRYLENFYFSPIKLFEYMAAGVCVVASRLGQITEVIDEGVNGLLCAPDDATDLHAVLGKVRKSAELRRRLGEEASRTVRARYTWGHSARAISKIVFNLTGVSGETSATPVP